MGGDTGPFCPWHPPSMGILFHHHPVEPGRWARKVLVRALASKCHTQGSGQCGPRKPGTKCLWLPMGPLPELLGGEVVFCRGGGGGSR